MPGIQPGYPIHDASAMQVIDQAGDDERVTRKAEIDRAFAYYDGRQRLPLKAEPDGSNASVILNLTGQALDDMVEFMGLPRLDIAGGRRLMKAADGRIGATVSAAQRALDRWWDETDQAEFVIDAALSGFIAGHTFVKLYVDDGQGAPESPDDSGSEGAPKAALLDPRMATVYWDAANVNRLLWYRLSWQVGDTSYRQDIVPNSLVAPADQAGDSGSDGWQIFEYAATAGALFRLTGQDGWPWPFPPLVEWKNRHAPHAYYGRTDVVIPLNDAVNFTASNVAKILKHHAGPQTIVTGARLDAQTTTGPGTIIHDLPADAKVFNLEMESDLASSLAFLDKLETRFFSEMQVVDLSSVKDRLGQITNFGVRMLFIRMTNLIAGKRRLYGRGLERVSAAILAMQGLAVERVDAVWDDMLPANRLEQVTELKTEREIGVVSKESASADLGRDFKTEQAQIALEKSDEAKVAADALATLGNSGAFA